MLSSNPAPLSSSSSPLPRALHPKARYPDWQGKDFPQWKGGGLPPWGMGWAARLPLLEAAHSAPRNPEGRHPPAVREQLPTPQSTGCAPARGGQTPHYIAVSKSRKPASGTSSEVLKRGLKGQLQGWQQASDPVSKGPEPRAEADRYKRATEHAQL